MSTSLTPARPLAIDEDIAFSDYNGVRNPRIEKRQRRLLGKLEVLSGLLDRDEHILLATHALSPTPLLEQITTGAVFVYIKRCLLVFSDKRILHFPVTGSYSYRNSIAQIDYSDVRHVLMKGSVLTVNYKNEEADKFLYIARRERRKIKSLIPVLPIASGAPTGRTRVHLCPRCKGPQTAGVYRCPGCGLEFKQGSTAARLSLLLPGGGYFYTGHWLLGISDALVELLLLSALALSLFDWVGGGEDSFVAVVVFGILIAIEKAVTIYHARFFVGEFIPKAGQTLAADESRHGV